jgi:hypothetical protein
MADLTAERRLVKSPPELWSELSEVDRLAHHLEAFGEIRITKLEPEHTVAWEADNATGTVSIEASGWGTKVTLTAELPDLEQPHPGPGSEPAEAESKEPPCSEPAYEPDPQPEPGWDPDPEEAAPLEVSAPLPEVVPEERPPPTFAPRRRGLLSRLFPGFWVHPSAERTPDDVPRPGTRRDWLERALTRSPSEPEEEPAAAEPATAFVQPETAPPREPEPEEAPPEPEPEPDEPAPEEEPPAAEAEDDGNGTLDPQAAEAALEAVLDTLGAAHHRPFSRS